MTMTLGTAAALAVLWAPCALAVWKGNDNAGVGLAVVGMFLSLLVMAVSLAPGLRGACP
jgi:hypothetical protein